MCADPRVRLLHAAIRAVVFLVGMAVMVLPAAAQTIAAGYYHTLILKSDGTVWAVGESAWTQAYRSMKRCEWRADVRIVSRLSVYMIEPPFADGSAHC